VSKVRSNAYLNRIALADWRQLFLSRVPDVRFRAVEDENPGARIELATLRRNGELSDYTDEELLTVELIASWKQ
jgi:hypothetical protein